MTERQRRPFGRRVPLDAGIRETARLLGIDHSWLSRLVRMKGEQSDLFAPDRSRMDGGRIVPMWSQSRIKEIKVALRESR